MMIKPINDNTINDNTINQHIKEVDNRYEIYKSKINELYNLNSKEFENIEKPKFENIEIKGAKEITEMLYQHKRDNISFQIHYENQKFDGILFNHVDKKELSISNPFTAYSNKPFPKSVECLFELDGDQYDFTLIRTEHSDENGKIIKCKIPKIIRRLKRRSNYRVKDASKTTIGLFIDERQKEFIGTVHDISETGIGFSFNEFALDNESLSLLHKNKDVKHPVIIDNNGDYICILIEIKYIKHEKSKKIVEVGAIFKINDDEDTHNINHLFNKMKQKEMFINQVSKTKNLINSSKRGIEL